MHGAMFPSNPMIPLNPMVPQYPMPIAYNSFLHGQQHLSPYQTNGNLHSTNQQTSGANQTAQWIRF